MKIHFAHRTYLFYLKNMDSYNKVLAVAVLFSIAIYPAFGQSQIYHCADTWTNQPCAGATPQFAEIVTTPSIAQNAKKEKEQILHSLIEARYRVKQRFAIDLNTSSVEKFCQREETLPAECQLRVDAEGDKIDAKVIEVQKLKLQNEELQLKKQTLANNNTENNSTAVVIQNIAVIRISPTARQTYFPIGIGAPFQSHATPQTRQPAPSRAEVPNDVRVPIPQ